MLATEGGDDASGPWMRGVGLGEQDQHRLRVKERFLSLKSWGKQSFAQKHERHDPKSRTTDRINISERSARESVTMRIMTSEDIDAGRSAKGGWTRKTLESWGVPWPPPSGWRRELMGKRPREPRGEKPKGVPPVSDTWTTKAGARIPIGAMTDEHLENTVKRLRDWIAALETEQERRLERAWAQSQGESE